jgi:hypothetical protein
MPASRQARLWAARAKRADAPLGATALLQFFWRIEKPSPGLSAYYLRQVCKISKQCTSPGRSAIIAEQVGEIL